MGTAGATAGREQGTGQSCGARAGLVGGLQGRCKGNSKAVQLWMVLALRKHGSQWYTEHISRCKALVALTEHTWPPPEQHPFAWCGLLKCAKGIEYKQHAHNKCDTTDQQYHTPKECWKCCKIH